MRRHIVEPDGTWHVHMAGIPYGEGNRRGLEKQVSMTQALKTLNLKRLPDLQNLMMGELEKAAAAHGIERRLMDCDRKHLDVPKYQQAMRNYNDLTDKIEQKRSRVAELDRDIKGKERTVARLDRSIETKTKRLNSLTEWLQEAEKRLDEILPNLAEIAVFQNWCDENNERWAEALDSGCAIAIEKFIADWNGRADAGRWKHAAQADDNVWDNELK